MTTFADQPLEEQIAQWRAYLRRRQAVHGPDVEELEGHLRDQLAALTEAGLAGDEAFLVAVKRMGSLDALSREFARAHSERLWKQLVMAPDADEPANTARTEIARRPGPCRRRGVGRQGAGAVRSSGSALMRKCRLSTSATPACSSSRCSPSTSCGSAGRTLSAASGWRCPSRPGLCSPTSSPFVDTQGSDTEVLTVLHLPIALWLAVGFAYVRGRWFADGGRMNFVRFSGELAIYYVLIALGGGVLTGFTFMMFTRHRDEA